jgi:hypothetical protein
MGRNRKSDRERLLKLIDGAPSAATGTARGESVEAVKGAPDAFHRLRSGVDAAMDGLRRGASGEGMALAWINRGLIAALVGIVIYGLFDLGTALTRANKAPSLSTQAPRTPGPALPASSGALGNFGNIFDQGRVDAGDGTLPVPGNAAAATSVSGLRLVGVDWGGDEPVALVEDKETHKTYFRKKDEKVGEWQVVRILRKKVVLSGPGGETELQ